MSGAYGRLGSEPDDWYEVRQTVSHKHIRHPQKPGTASFPHPKGEMTIGTLKSISKPTEVPRP